MGLSERAQVLKGELLQVVTGKQELKALEAEWQDALLWSEEMLYDAADGQSPLILELAAERQRLRQWVAVRQMHNYMRLQAIPMTPLQRLVMRLRYVQGHTWGEIVQSVGKSKQYLLRQHNRVLEQMVTKGYPRRGSANGEKPLNGAENFE